MCQSAPHLMNVKMVVARRLASRTSKRRIVFYVIATSLILPVCCMAQAKTQNDFTIPPGISNNVRQIVFVTGALWDSRIGKLLRIERNSEQWVQVGRVISVNFGGKGLAWGTGLHQPIEGDPQKKEGDQRAPAGIFELGPVFGYALTPPLGTKLLYRNITDRDYYVDDTNSSDYNTWFTINSDEPNEPSRRWRSFEVMRRADNLYSLGIVIHHNVAPIVRDRGSAIFFHVWRGPNSPTAGCTSMSREDLVSLVTWLDPAKSPIVIQAPISKLKMLRFATSP